MKKKSGFPLEIRVGSFVSKIYCTPTVIGYESFTLVYYEDQARKREYFSLLDEAKSRAKAVGALLSKGEHAALALTSQDAAAFFRAKELLKPAGATLEAACREYVEAFKLLGGVSILNAAREYATRHARTLVPITVQEAVDEYLQAKRKGEPTKRGTMPKQVSAKYLRDLEKKLGLFAERFHCQLASVTADEIAQMLDDLDFSGKTKNDYRDAISYLFEFAKKRKYLPPDYAVVEDVDRTLETETEIEFFTPEEMSKLLNYTPEGAAPTPGKLVPTLAIAAFAGIRTEEILRLDWKEVNLPQRFIDVTRQKSKTKMRRFAPVTDNLAKWLAPYAQQTGPVWPLSVPYFFQSLQNLAEDAGVVWRRNAVRHSFATYRCAAIANLNQVALECGHSVDILVQHYRGIVTPEDAAKWFSIEPQAPANVVTLPAVAVA